MLSISIIKRFRDALLLLAIGIFGVAQADGPVSVANLPGGGGSVLVDTDVTEGGGLGQRWGRAGGRTITYHVASPGTFSALSFGVTQAAAQPHVAFDGTVNAGEVLSYNAGLSTPAGGIAVWSGSALLQLVNQPPFPVATRLTMKVTNASNSPVGMGFEGGPSPVANVLSAGDFKVNLLFEMADVGNANVFHPVLDYYDFLQTPDLNQPPQNNVGPVMTGVNTGFFYTVLVQGMTLEEHDSHLQSLFDVVTPQISNMNGKINKIAQDWDPRWNDLGLQVQGVQTAINNNVAPTLSQIQQQVQQLVGSLGNNNNSGLATKQDTDGLRDMLMIVLGVMPCPPQAPPGFCNDFKSLHDLGQASNQILIGLNNANNAIGDVNGKADGILIGLNNANTAIGGANTGIGSANAKLDAAATKLDTLATHGEVTGLNGILIGLNNALQDKASQASVNGLDGKVNGLSAKIDALQGSLDNAGSSSLDMIVAPVDTQGSKTARWIVKISRDGELVPAVINGVATIRTGKGASVYANVLGNTTIVTLAPGLYEVTVNLVKDVSDGSLFVFQASTGGAGALFGNAMGAPFK